MSRYGSVAIDLLQLMQPPAHLGDFGTKFRIAILPKLQESSVCAACLSGLPALIVQPAELSKHYRKLGTVLVHTL